MEQIYLSFIESLERLHKDACWCNDHVEFVHEGMKFRVEKEDANGYMLRCSANMLSTNRNVDDWIRVIYDLESTNYTPTFVYDVRKESDGYRIDVAISMLFLFDPSIENKDSYIDGCLLTHIDCKLTEFYEYYKNLCDESFDKESIVRGEREDILRKAFIPSYCRKTKDRLEKDRKFGDAAFGKSKDDVHMLHLQHNATLQGGKYRIEGILGRGGFGITYIAVQCGLEREVVIKEFFMKDFCVRDENTGRVILGTEGSHEMVNRFREKFVKEARNIARLNHPNIVRIIDVFEENGTAYYVMEYIVMGSLADKVKYEGCIPEYIATRYILQVAKALEYIHQQNMNHLDVKPANIMLTLNDDAVLIDFGLSKQYDATTGNQTSTTPVGISEGYAPMEQYKQGGVGEFSPETDIYALGATFFKLLTGVTPPSASDVNEDGVPVDELKAKGVSDNAIAVICKAMEGRKRDRMRTVQEFIKWFKSAQCVASDSTDDATLMTSDETTLLTPKTQLAEEEQKRKEAETKEKTVLGKDYILSELDRLGIMDLSSRNMFLDNPERIKSEYWLKRVKETHKYPSTTKTPLIIRIIIFVVVTAIGWWLMILILSKNAQNGGNAVLDPIIFLGVGSGSPLLAGYLASKFKM